MRGNAVKRTYPLIGAWAIVFATAILAQATEINSNASNDWPQWGGSSLRNNAPQAGTIPAEWAPGEFDRKTGAWQSEQAVNVKWVARLGSQTYGNPVIAGGRILVGTNNGAGYLKRYPSTVDLGCLLCLQESDGQFLWQASSEKLPGGGAWDWPLQGICCSPLVEGDRVWYVTSRGEVVCLDAAGFTDGEDDGPLQRELGRLCEIRPAKAGAPDELAAAIQDLNSGKISAAIRQRCETAGSPLPSSVTVRTETADKRWTWRAKIDGTERDFVAEIRADEALKKDVLSVFRVILPVDLQEADTVWKLDMMGELKVQQHNMCSCSVTSFGDILYVCTSNGVDESDAEVPAPEAPSFLALDKQTGKLLWSDNSPGANILHGQWSSPAAGVLGGVPQAIFAGGDGWVYSFRADAGKDGQPELLWKFDANPKESKWVLGGSGTRSSIIATPVIHEGLVYVVLGEEPEGGAGQGYAWCIDPTKRGDVSPTLAVKADDHSQIIPVRREQAVIPTKGEAAIPNPNSAVVWGYNQADQNGDGQIDFEEEFHRCVGTPAIQNGLFVIADFGGLVHCLDAKTGKVHWTHDLLAAVWGSPTIADGRFVVGDEDGDLTVFELTAEKKEPLYEMNMGSSVYSTPTIANGVLFITTRTHLFAIQVSPQ
jgi:outer membrane protein assembly factor BamB